MVGRRPEELGAPVVWRVFAPVLRHGPEHPARAGCIVKHPECMRHAFCRDVDRLPLDVESRALTSAGLSAGAGATQTTCARPALGPAFASSRRVPCWSGRARDERLGRLPSVTHELAGLDVKLVEMITLAEIVSRHTCMSAIRSGFSCCKHLLSRTSRSYWLVSAGCPAFWSIACDGAEKPPFRCGMLHTLIFSLSMPPFDP